MAPRPQRPNMSHLLPSAAEKGDEALANCLIFRGRAESHLTFRVCAATARVVYAGTCSLPSPPGPPRRRTGVAGPAVPRRSAGLARPPLSRRAVVVWAGLGRRVEGCRSLTAVSRRAGVAH